MGAVGWRCWRWCWRRSSQAIVFFVSEFVKLCRARSRSRSRALAIVEVFSWARCCNVPSEPCWDLRHFAGISGTGGGECWATQPHLLLFLRSLLVVRSFSRRLFSHAEIGNHKDDLTTFFFARIHHPSAAHPPNTLGTTHRWVRSRTET